jgi:HEAT repeat protein
VRFAPLAASSPGALAGSLFLLLLLAAASCASPESEPAPAARAETAAAPSAPSPHSETLRGYWRLYKTDDAGWPAAREAWLALGQGDSWILVENLVAEIVRSSDAGDARALSRARREIASIPGPAVPFLVEALEHGDNVTRRHCADALVAIGAPAVPAITGRLSSYGPPARRSAVALLGEIGDPGAVPALARVAAADAEWTVRAEAVGALARFLPATEAAERAIAEPLPGDADPFVRRKAAEALAAGTAPEGAAALRRALDDAVGDVREAAARSLARRRDASAVEPLVAALERESEAPRGDAEARRAIHDALRALTGFDCGTDAASWRRRLNESR